MLTWKLSCSPYVNSSRTQVRATNALNGNTRTRAEYSSKHVSWTPACGQEAWGAQEGAVYGVVPSLQLFHVISKTRVCPGLAPGATTTDQARLPYPDRKSHRLPLLVPGYSLEG